MSKTENTGIITSGHSRVSGRSLLAFSLRNWWTYGKGASMPDMIHLHLASAFLLKVRAVFPQFECH